MSPSATFKLNIHLNKTGNPNKAKFVKLCFGTDIADTLMTNTFVVSKVLIVLISW